MIPRFSRIGKFHAGIPLKSRQHEKSTYFQRERLTRNRYRDFNVYSNGHLVMKLDVFVVSMQAGIFAFIVHSNYAYCRYCICKLKLIKIGELDNNNQKFMTRFPLLYVYIFFFSYTAVENKIVVFMTPLCKLLH